MKFKPIRRTKEPTVKMCANIAHNLNHLTGHATLIKYNQWHHGTGNIETTFGISLVPDGPKGVIRYEFDSWNGLIDGYYELRKGYQKK